MNQTIEALLERPYVIIDILPKQVPKDSPGRYFAVEKYYLEEKRLSAIKQKHTDLILKLNCYKSISADCFAQADPPPALIAEKICSRRVCIMVDGSLIVSEPDETYLTVFDPDEDLLDLIKALAAGEGLYVWKPDEVIDRSDLSAEV